MAGIVLKAHFPPRVMVQIVATNIFRYLFRGAARNWIRNIGGAVPALSSMTLLLLLSGVVGLVGFALYNLETIQSAEASLLHVYVRDDAPPADVDLLWDRLAADPRVASVSYTTRAEALTRAQHMPGLPQLTSATDSNPFPASLDVRVKNIDDVAVIDRSVRYEIAVDPVYATSYDRGAYQRIQAFLLGVAIAGIAFLSLLGFVAVTVTMNSIRAAIHSRRDEVTIMQLVGAPRWMVRGPFVIEGAITGALSGAVAGLVVFGLTAAGLAAGSTAFAQFAPGVTAGVAAIAATIVFATGLGLGSGSSLISVRRHLES